MRSWLEAAIEALKRGGPMSVSQILTSVEAMELRAISGRTPEATIGAALYTALQNGNPSIRLVRPGVFEHTGKDAQHDSVGTLGRLEEMDPRDIWRDEARHFTPWLLQNADYLAEVLGLEIDLEAREHPVGNFSLDLLGRDVTNSCPLVIENQLEATDHRHLGQLLTYAAGTSARTVVWISSEFREEHQKVLDYLNDSSRDSPDGRNRFFGVEVSVVRIADSVPAPKFTVVASPGDWSADLDLARSTHSENPTKLAYRTFWARYLQAVHAAHPGLTNVRSTTSANWIVGNYLRRGIRLNLAFIKTGVSVEIYIDLGDRPRNEDVFFSLQEHRGSIETAIGQSLLWQDLEGKRACRIRLALDGSIHDTASHPRLIESLVHFHVAFKNVFRSYVTNLPDEIWNLIENPAETTD